MESSLSLLIIWEEEAFKYSCDEMKSGNVVHILGGVPSTPITWGLQICSS